MACCSLGNVVADDERMSNSCSMRRKGWEWAKGGRSVRGLRTTAAAPQLGDKFTVDPISKATTVAGFQVTLQK